jgi:hypothetical protein
LLSSVAWLLFMIFLRRLSFYVDEEKLAEEASEIMVRGIIILFLSPFIIFTVVGVAAVGRLLGLILAIIILLFSIYYFFLFLRRQLDLIGSLRQVIASRY